VDNQTLFYLSGESLDFPNTNLALTDPNGLLAIGGDLSTERLISSYTNGIFPWFSGGDPIMWWSPNPRAIIPINNIQVNRTLKKFINRTSYTVSLNTAFEQVIALCADAPFSTEETWIVEDMKNAYIQLYNSGKAHSIEVWDNDELVGGLYGVAIGGFFSGESMFYKKDNASKIALVALASHLSKLNINFIDCQIINPFLQSMGCIEIPRAEFTHLSHVVKKIKIPKEFWQPKTVLPILP
jgi:leucyl/phenylalanyl-tRNA---protein transferase